MSDLFEGVNLVPVGVDHRVETLAGVAVTLDVLAGYPGSGGNLPSVVGFGIAAHGTVGLEPRQGDAPAGGGVFRYVPQTGFVGLDYFSYQIGRLDEQSPGGWRIETVGWVEVRVWGVNRSSSTSRNERGNAGYFVGTAVKSCSRTSVRSARLALASSSAALLRGSTGGLPGTSSGHG